MKPPPAPIRFLVAVAGCWIGARALVLWSERPDGPMLAATAARAAPAAPAALPAALAEGMPKPSLPPRREAPSAWSVRRFLAFPPRSAAFAAARREAPQTAVAHLAASVVAPMELGARAWSAPPVAPPLAYPPLAPATPSMADTARPGRWAGSAWLFVREEIGAGGLAPGGTLGGSQAGGRLAYRINRDARRPLAVSARLYAPLERPQGAEAALGLDWQPLAGVPIHILAERRQRLGREGRSDFGLTVYGGGERRLLRGRLRLEAYGQAGLVGVEERDLFADGAVRASTRIGPVEVGAGAWGGAQPGAARLDLGPQASIRLPVGSTAIRASAEWRFRVAGDASPDSGPAFTIATDF